MSERPNHLSELLPLRCCFLMSTCNLAALCSVALLCCIVHVLTILRVYAVRHLVRYFMYFVTTLLTTVSGGARVEQNVLLARLVVVARFVCGLLYIPELFWFWLTSPLCGTVHLISSR